MPFDKTQYDVQYNRKHVKRKFIPFNDQIPEDVQMLSWLATKDNVTAYVKNLIRADMARAEREGRLDVYKDSLDRIRSQFGSQNGNEGAGT